MINFSTIISLLNFFVVKQNDFKKKTSVNFPHNLFVTTFHRLHAITRIFSLLTGF